jgi:hypothetical protein
VTEDPIVAEIRAIREAYASRFNYDLEAIVRDIQEQERRGDWPTVILPPKRIEKAADDREIEVD